MSALRQCLLAVVCAGTFATAPVPTAAQQAVRAAAPIHEVGFTETSTSLNAAALTLETDVERIVRKAETAGANPVVPQELAARIAKAKQGETIPMGDYDMEALPLLSIRQTAAGPPFLFTDDPEYIRVPEGAVLRERINPGSTRLYLYHCNGTTGTVSRITAVVDNLADKPMSLSFSRYAFTGVSMDYGLLGQTGAKAFLEQDPNHANHASPKERRGPVQQAPKPRIIPPHGSEPLDPAAEESTVRFNELIHGWYEFEVDQPARVTVLQTTPDTPGPVASKRIVSLLPPRSRSGAGRGYYAYCDYDVTNAPGEVLDTADGPRQIMIADGKLDRWMTGVDSTTTLPCILKGNYGSVYKIRLKRTSSDGKALAALIWNARTKSGCKTMSACTQVSPGKFPAGSVMVPTDARVLRGGDKAVLLQVFPAPPKGKTDEIEINYTPPGASCLPNPILLVPIGQ